MPTSLRTSHDISELDRAPQVYFTIHSPDVITGQCDGFSLRIEREEPDRAFVRISLDGENYCKCIYLASKSCTFEEDDFTLEVSGFVSGILWSAWRRRQLAKKELG